MNLTGLTECEVKKRREEGKVQIEANGITKSIGQI